VAAGDDLVHHLGRQLRLGLELQITRDAAGGAAPFASLAQPTDTYSRAAIIACGGGRRDGGSHGREDE